MCEIGTTNARPTSSRKKPITRDAATINPQTAIVIGLASTASTDVRTATATPTLRSSSKGNETTLMLSATTAKTKPIALPRTIRAQPWMW
jgi:hypothetical protein